MRVHRPRGNMFSAINSLMPSNAVSLRVSCSSCKNTILMIQASRLRKLVSLSPCDKPRMFWLFYRILALLPPIGKKNTTVWEGSWNDPWGWILEAMEVQGASWRLPAAVWGGEVWERLCLLWRDCQRHKSNSPCLKGMLPEALWGGPGRSTRKQLTVDHVRHNQPFLLFLSHGEILISSF